MSETLGRIIPTPTTDDTAPKLVILGDEGQYVVAYGHVPARLFTCLAVAHIAREYGVHIALMYTDEAHDAPAVDDMALGVVHAWGIQYGANEGPFAGTNKTEPYVWWEGVTENAPGAFPMTFIDVEG